MNKRIFATISDADPITASFIDRDAGYVQRYELMFTVAETAQLMRMYCRAIASENYARIIGDIKQEECAKKERIAIEEKMNEWETL
jgi:hypothetical protein